MKTRLYVTLFVVLVILSACAPAEETILTVGDQAYTQSQLEGMDTISVDYTNKDGETTSYTGVSLAALLEEAGVTGGGANLTLKASDGYEADLSMEEALACADCIVAFDDGSLRTVMPDFSGKLQVKDLVEISVQ